MIGGVTKFGGRSRDAHALVAHLGKDQPGGAIYVAGPTTAAANMAGLVAEARLLAAARGVQARPFLHLHLSPSSSLARAPLMRAAEIVLQELGVTDQPWGVEFHGKDRRSGTGEIHAHIVVGRAGASGSLLRSGFEKIRVETAVRIAEFEVGDRHVLGRHHSASVRYLAKTGRHDVVASLRAAHGEKPPRPQGLSAEKRMKADRRGVDLVAQREVVRSTWSRSDDGKSFAAVLAEDGLELRHGEKRGVWIVAAGDVEIGSVDRLLGERRRTIAARLRSINPSAIKVRDDIVQSRDHSSADESDRPPISRGATASDRDRGLSESAYGRGRRDRGESGHRGIGADRSNARRPEPEAGPDGGHAGALGASRQRRRGIAALTVSRAIYVDRERLTALRQRALAILGHDLLPRPSRLPEPLVPATDPVPALSPETKTPEQRKEQQPASAKQRHERNSAADRSEPWQPPRPF